MPPVSDRHSVFILCTINCESEILALRINGFERVEVDVDGVIFKAELNAEDEALIFSALIKESYFRIFENCWASPNVHGQLDSLVIKKFFDLIASEYDGIVHKDWNISCYEYLFHRIYDSKINSPDILDFGCGTGIISFSNFFDGTPSIVGFDFCEKMLSLARNHGLRTLSASEFDAQVEKSFDLVISCYVFHYGISPDIFFKLVHLLRSGGKLAANLHKDIKISNYIEFCKMLNLHEFKYNLDHSPFGTVLIIERL